jgi:lysozyme
MKISEKGLRMIENFEGCLLKASNTLDNVWTIGYGQTGYYYGKRIRKGMTTTRTAAHKWLRDHSISVYENAVNRRVKVNLNQNQFDALVSFVYNIGVGAFSKSTVLKRLNIGDYAGAAEAFEMWVHCNGKTLPGLVRRREEEKELFLTPVTNATTTKSTHLIREGDTGDNVKVLQHRLNLLGAQLVEDGIWGVQTDTAVRNFQYKHGLTVDCIVGTKTQKVLIQAAILATAKSIGDYMVAHKWHYKGDGYIAKNTFSKTKKCNKPGSSCSHFCSWVLQDVRLLENGKRISHDNGKVTGRSYLLGCEVIEAKGKTWNKIKNLYPGDTCVWDSNIAIYAGDGKWYDAGGPFKANTNNKRYINVGPIAPYYDKTKPIYYIIRAKV